LIPQELKDEVVARYETSQYGMIRSAGAFPFLSQSDEFSMFLQVHMQRVSRIEEEEKEEAEQEKRGGRSDPKGKEEVEEKPKEYEEEEDSDGRGR
jgi:hypothetical protein